MFNILKFKDYYNKSYEVDVKDDDLVINIKRKLSKKVYTYYKNIVLIFKNEILIDDKLISHYKIESNKFLLWFEGDDCMRYSNDDSDIIKCITIVDDYNDDEYFVNMNKNNTIRMLKSQIARKYRLNEEEFYLEFIKNNLPIDDCKSLEQCGFSNGCSVGLFYKDIVEVRIQKKYIFDLYIQIFKYNLRKFVTVGQLKQICSNKTDVDSNEISLQCDKKYLLDDEATLEQCGLSDRCWIELFNDDIIYLCIKLPGGQCGHICVNKYSTFGKLKQLIGEKFGIDWEHFDVVFLGSQRCDEVRLNECGIGNNDTINVVCLIRGGGCNSYIASMIPLTKGHESFKITNVVDLNDLITKICARNSDYDSIIDHSLMKLYSDADKIKQITNNQDLQQFYNNNHHGNEITLYYELNSELDEFEIIEKLGQGSFGKVYKYRKKNTNQMFALKKFDLFAGSLNTEKFQREVDCYLRLKSHRRIIKYENHFIDRNKSYILMEHMERGSLAYFVKHNDPLSEPKIAKYARQILEGLEYLHDNQILHRDLKGDNILLNDKDDLKLCDFGLAKILTDISSEDFLNGVVQSTIGSVNWMSPEILNGESCGPASDIWSFGATMVEILTKKYPHEGLAHGKMVLCILSGDLKFNYPENSSDDIKLFINSCLKRNPKERANIKYLNQSSFLNKILI